MGAIDLHLLYMLNNRSYENKSYETRNTGTPNNSTQKIIKKS